MKISVVIPCYRSEKTIRPVVLKLAEDLGKRPENDYEIILVNDRSPDRVWKEIVRLTETVPNLCCLNLAKNFGQHSALMAGYGMCTGDVVVSMDDDGQTESGQIYTLIDALSEEIDVVYADYPVKQETPFRRFGSMLNAKMNETMIGKPQNIVPNSYFAAKAYIIQEILKYRNAYPYVDGLIFRTTSNIGKVEIEHKKRLEGTSGYTFIKLLKLWMNGFTAFSVKPLRMATITGLACALLGFLYGAVIIVSRFYDHSPIVGWSSLMAVLLFVGGMIMIMLGIVGEYIGRVYICINNSPQYVVKDMVRSPETGQKGPAQVRKG